MRKPLFLNAEECYYLLGRLGDDPLKLRESILQTVAELRDAKAKLDEITARANANAHFVAEVPEPATTITKERKARDKFDRLLSTVPPAQKEASFKKLSTVLSEKDRQRLLKELEKHA